MFLVYIRKQRHFNGESCLPEEELIVSGDVILESTYLAVQCSCFTFSLYPSLGIDCEAHIRI